MQIYHEEANHSTGLAMEFGVWRGERFNNDGWKGISSSNGLRFQNLLLMVVPRRVTASTQQASPGQEILWL